MPAPRDGPDEFGSFPPSQQSTCTRDWVCSPFLSPSVDLTLSLSREADTFFSEGEMKRPTGLMTERL